MGSAEVTDAVIARACAAYLGLAIGDALGATVEFMTPREIAAAHGTHQHMAGGGWLRLKAGQVTDDTGMALALGESILAVGCVDATAAARAFDAWMRARPVDIGHTVRRGLVRWRTTGIAHGPPDEHAAGNGAAMRVLPAALATFGQHERVVRAACRAQARVTHHNPLSDAACETLALMLQAALRGAGRDELLCRHARPLVERHALFAFESGCRRENPGGYVVETLQAVFQALFERDGFEACLIDVVNRGGDADTTGAIAGMLAGALYGPKALPERWLSVLDPAIRRACVEQAKALLEIAAREPVGGLLDRVGKTSSSGT